MKHILKDILIITTLIISSCSSTGVIPMGNNTYMIGKKDGYPGVGVSLSVRAEVYNEAVEFCTKKKLEVKTLNITTLPAVPGQLGSTELQFSCVFPTTSNSKPEYYKILNDNTLKATNSIDSEYLAYSDSSKTGIITLNTSLKNRDDALKLIGDICSSKNISLVSGGTHKKDGATYKVMDETYSSNELTIKFNCLY